MSGPDDELNRGVLAAILVGGSSSRLGRPKARADVGGLPILERVVRAVRTVADEVVLIGKSGRASPLPDIRFLHDEHPESCALAGVVRALEAAGDRRVLVTACDHPFLSPSLLAFLVDVPDDRAARVPEVEGRLEPLVAVYRARPTLPHFARRLSEGRLALAAAVRGVDADIVPEADLRKRDPDLLSFVNVNTREDLDLARRTASRLDEKN